MQIDSILSDAKTYADYRKYDTIIVGALVGSQTEKKSIVTKILNQCGSKTRIIIRSVEGLGALLYPRFNSFANKNIKSIRNVPVPKDVINPIIVIN